MDERLSIESKILFCGGYSILKFFQQIAPQCLLILHSYTLTLVCLKVALQHYRQLHKRSALLLLHTCEDIQQVVRIIFLPIRQDGKHFRVENFDSFLEHSTGSLILYSVLFFIFRLIVSRYFWIKSAKPRYKTRIFREYLF